jgi:flagellin-like hook-associated protein FlgL
LVAAIMEMQQLKTQQDAALQVRASMPRTSLFDYLR